LWKIAVGPFPHCQSKFAQIVRELSASDGSSFFWRLKPAPDGPSSLVAIHDADRVFSSDSPPRPIMGQLGAFGALTESIRICPFKLFASPSRLFAIRQQRPA